MQLIDGQFLYTPSKAATFAVFYKNHKRRLFRKTL
jgi:hypothetical protein